MTREQPEVLRVEKLLTQALESDDGQMRALVDALEELTRADHLARRLGARLRDYAEENRELRAAVCALRRRLQQEGRDIELEEDAA